MSQPNGAGQRVCELVDVASTKQPTAASDAPVAAYRSLFRDFLVRFCVAITIAVFLLVCGELLAYWHHSYGNRDIMEPTVRRGLANAGASEREYWKQFEAADAVTYQPYVLWRRQAFQGSMININAEGIRQTVHSECNDHNFTIWMFGDSTLWGSGARDDQTIASFLAAKYELAGRKVCVVNYGEKAWANTQEVIELIEQLKHSPHKPNVVIFYDGGTEAFTAYQTHRADMPSNYEGFKTYLDGWNSEQKPGFLYLRRTNTHRLLNAIAAKLPFHEKKKPVPMSEDQLESLADAILQNYQQNMDIVGLLAQQYGFRPIFVWYPTLVVGHKPLTALEQQAQQDEEERFPGMARIYRAAYSKCEQTHRPDLYYLGNIFDNQKSSLFLGIAHVKPEGNSIIADRLFQIVEHPPQSDSTRGLKSHQERERRLRQKPA